METEAIIKKVIEEEFKDYTVITIAHRLTSILSSDCVAVLETGELLEFDSPIALLSRESRFKTLCDTYGAEQEPGRVMIHDQDMLYHATVAWGKF